MHIEQLDISGVLLITPKLRYDLRGHFEKLFDAAAFSALGMNTDIREQFQTISRKNVIRGMHFQSPPHDCAKYITVGSGSVLDVILDLRTDSKSFGKSIAIALYGGDRQMLYIPTGCAHGFLALEDNTCTRYLQTHPFAQENDHGIHYDSFGFHWPVSHPILSERDMHLQQFCDYQSPF